jgi:hypothetical protein
MVVSKVINRAFAHNITKSSIYFRYMKLRRSLLYFLIFVSISSFVSYKIIVKAYSGIGEYDIENLKSQAFK